MSFRRYEIILPTRYNDGSPIPQSDYWVTTKELLDHFEAVSFLPETVHGSWIHQGRTYEEQNVRVFIDVPDTAESEAFFVQYKQRLKERFRQIEIWIASYQIRLT
jgi:hypothetical protein